jgi:RNA polymerase sigma factor (TIGR02999 family)
MPDPSDASKPRADLTLLLSRMQSGEAGASDALAEAVYDDLLAMARGHLGRDIGPDLAGVTIQPTMLANDTLMKLIRQRQKYDNSGHFFAIASRLMMRVLLDYHRTRNAQKRGRGAVHVSLEPEHDDVSADEMRASRDDGGNDVDVEAFSSALQRLADLDPRKADVVRYRILWGLTVSEISDTLEVATSTVDRDWQFAKAWLTRELQQH